jgi:membrane-associated protease RseP (regulator of RpoE activity)
MKMRKPLSILLITGVAAAAPIAAAAPAQNKSSDDAHVTVTAGRGRLGLAVIQASPELRAQLGAPGDRGVLVDRVIPDSPAARAGVRVGDVVLEVDGDAVTSATEMLEAMSDHEKGEQITITALRAGQRMQLVATLDDHPGRRRPSMPGFSRAFEGFDRQFPQFQGQGELKRDLEEARRRIDELERRLEKLERT